jgi:hypothetical protein
MGMSAEYLRSDSCWVRLNAPPVGIFFWMGMEVELNFVRSVAGVREVSQELSVVSGGKEASISMPMVPCCRTSPNVYPVEHSICRVSRADCIHV